MRSQLLPSSRDVSFVLKGSSYHFVMRYCLCLCVHILSLVHVVSLDICEVKIVAKLVFRKYLNSQRESNPCLPIAGSVVLPLDYRVSDSNAMLTRDLVPIVFVCSYTKSSTCCKLGYM